MLVVSPIMMLFFGAFGAYLMIENAPTSVFAISMMGLTVLALMFILAYAWPHMAIDEPKMRCPRCCTEIRDDFEFCPACTMADRSR